MPWLTAIPVYVWAGVFFPLAVILWFLKPIRNNKMVAILIILDYLGASLYCFYAINWVVVNYFYRFITLILSVVIAFRLLVKVKKSPFLPKVSFFSLAGVGISLLVLLMVGYMDVRLFQSFDYKAYKDKPVLLWFPVRRGMYTIMNGGNGIYGLGMNDYLHDWLGQPTGKNLELAYAADIVKMDIYGHMSNGTLPNLSPEYLGMDDTVYSPCQGEVVFVGDSLPDVKPFSPESNFSQDTLLGNKIVIKCYIYYITLSNLRNEGIMVKAGDQVFVGEIIASVGSSGANTIPHMHIHATIGGWNGEGQAVPMLFDGVFAVNQFATRNKIYIPH